MDEFLKLLTESPDNEALAKMLTQGMQGAVKSDDIGGNLLKTGLSTAGTAVFGPIGGVAGTVLGQLLVPNKQEPQPINPRVQRNLNPYGMATGGMVQNGQGLVPVEVEGDEMFELPNGQVGEFQGPDHEQGGIPTQLPPGTNVYSKRMTGADGRSMADRKESRERRLRKILAQLDKRPTDAPTINSVSREVNRIQAEEEQDMQIMQMYQLRDMLAQARQGQEQGQMSPEMMQGQQMQQGQMSPEMMQGQMPQEMIQGEMPMMQAGGVIGNNPNNIYNRVPRKGAMMNPDGSQSTHLMAREYMPDKGWVAFPTLFQNEDESWLDMSNNKNWQDTYKEALKRNEVFEFGDDEQAAIEFADKGNWKQAYQPTFDYPNMVMPRDNTAINMPMMQAGGTVNPPKKNKDSAIEDFIEYIDISGYTSWDDAYTAFVNWRNRQKNAPLGSDYRPTFDEFVDIASAVPAYGKAGKIINIAANIGGLKQDLLSKPKQQLDSSSYDTGTEARRDDTNVSIPQENYDDLLKQIFVDDLIANFDKPDAETDEFDTVVKRDNTRVDMRVPQGKINTNPQMNFIRDEMRVVSAPASSKQAARPMMQAGGVIRNGNTMNGFTDLAMLLSGYNKMQSGGEVISFNNKEQAQEFLQTIDINSPTLTEEDKTNITNALETLGYDMTPSPELTTTQVDQFGRQETAIDPFETLVKPAYNEWANQQPSLFQDLLGLNQSFLEGRMSPGYESPYITDTRSTQVSDEQYQRPTDEEIKAAQFTEQDKVLAGLNLNPTTEEEIKKLQTALQAAGYDLGPKGVDGKLGKYTNAAIDSWKTDYANKEAIQKDLDNYQRSTGLGAATDTQISRLAATDTDAGLLNRGALGEDFSVAAKSQFGDQMIQAGKTTPTTPEAEKTEPTWKIDPLTRAGYITSGAGPLITTILNRLGDEPTPNFYANFGRDAERALDAAERGIAGSRDRAYEENRLAQNLRGRQARNAARSSNVMQAMQQAALTSGMKANEQITGQYQNALRALLANRAQFEQGQDQAVMKGREAAYTADLQNRDQFSTNLASNLANAGSMMQTLGRQKEIFDVYNQMGKSGGDATKNTLLDQLMSLYSIGDENKKDTTK